MFSKKVKQLKEVLSPQREFPKPEKIEKSEKRRSFRRMLSKPKLGRLEKQNFGSGTNTSISYVASDISSNIQSTIDRRKSDDSGYDENGTTKSHILNIKILSATDLIGEKCYIKIYVNGKRVAISKPVKGPFEWNAAFSSKIGDPAQGVISVQAFAYRTKDGLIGQEDKHLNTLNIGSNEIVNFNLMKNEVPSGQVKLGLHIIPPSGYIADESIADTQSSETEPAKTDTVADLLQDAFCPNSFQLDIELKRGIALKAMDLNGYSDPFCRFLMDGVLLCESETKQKCLNPEWNQFLPVKVPARPGSLVIEVFDRDMFGFNDLIGCNQIDITPLILEVASEQCIALRPAQTAPENPKLGQITFSLKVSPFEDENSSITAVDGRHKRGKKILGTVILRVLSVEHFQRTAVLANTRRASIKLRLHKQEFSTKTKNCNEKFSFTLFQKGTILHQDQTLFLDLMDSGKTVRSKINTSGSAKLDLAQFQRDVLHQISVKIKNSKNEIQAIVKLAMTISGSENSKRNEKYENSLDTNLYGLQKTFKAFKDVGILKVTVHNAKDLIVCDKFGKSDPYCLVDLGNQRFRTRTIYKTLNPEWERTFYFDISELYQNLFITVFDEDEKDADDFMGRFCIPILDMIQNEKIEYRLKSKQLTKLQQGSVTITCSRFYNGIRGNLKLFKPMAEDYNNPSSTYEPKYNLSTFFKNWDRLKAAMPNTEPMMKILNGIIHWNTPIISFAFWLFSIFAIYNFEPWMITAALPPILLLGLTAPGLLQTTKKVDQEKKGLFEHKKALDQMVLEIQKYVDFGAGFLEKIFHTFIWIRPQATFTLSIVICIMTAFLYYVSVRTILILWTTKKLCIYGIKPNYVGNNELFDFLSRIPTIPDLTRFKAEVVERIFEISGDEENSSDSSDAEE